MEGLLYHQNLLHVSEIICFEIISCYHNDLWAGYYEIKKNKKLVNRKYFWPTLCQDVDVYIKRFDICLALKTVRHKPYGDLQTLLME